MAEHPADPRCTPAPGEDIPAEGTLLYRFTEGGDSVLDSTDPVGPLDVLTFRLVVRKAGDTVAARIDSSRLTVTSTPDFPRRVEVSADGRFVEVVLQREIIALHGTRSRLALAVRGDMKGKISMLLYALAIPLAFLQEWMSDVIYVAVALMWLVPDRRIESRLEP